MVIFMMHKPYLSESMVSLFAIINYVFLLIFVCEASLKLSCLGWQYFNDTYNLFDFIIITLSLSTTALDLTKVVNLGN